MHQNHTSCRRNILKHFVDDDVDVELSLWSIENPDLEKLRYAESSQRDLKI